MSVLEITKKSSNFITLKELGVIFNFSLIKSSHTELKSHSQYG